MIDIQEFKDAFGGDPFLIRDNMKELLSKLPFDVPGMKLLMAVCEECTAVNIKNGTEYNDIDAHREILKNQSLDQEVIIWLVRQKSRALIQASKDEVDKFITSEIVMLSLDHYDDLSDSLANFLQRHICLLNEDEVRFVMKWVFDWMCYVSNDDDEVVSRIRNRLREEGKRLKKRFKYTSNSIDMLIGEIVRTGIRLQEDIIREMWSHGGWSQLRTLSCYDHLPGDLILNYLGEADGSRRDSTVLENLKVNPAMPEEGFFYYATDEQEWWRLAQNPSLPKEIRNTILISSNWQAIAMLLKTDPFENSAELDLVVKRIIDASSGTIAREMDQASFFEDFAATKLSRLQPETVLNLVKQDIVNARGNGMTMNRIATRFPMYLKHAPDDETRVELIVLFNKTDVGPESFKQALDEWPEMPEGIIEAIFSRLKGGSDATRFARLAMASHPNTPEKILKDLQKYGKNWPAFLGTIHKNMHERKIGHFSHLKDEE